MAKITFIGAGSTVFAKNLLVDMFNYPELAGAEVCLHDIDEARLRTSTSVAHRVAEALHAHPTITATTDRRAALAGASYVICMIQVGGYEPATVVDFEIPKKYGLRQTIGDTLGIGGIMRGLRTVPVLLAIARDMEELCPDALFLNYVNPMAINCWALNRASRIKTVGLCHSVQGTAKQLARDIGVPYQEIDYLCAGINHVAFYLRLERSLPDGTREDLYPRLRRVAAEARVPAHNRVRYEVLQRLGYFVTESSEHFAEYVPWFIKRDRPDLIERFNIPLDEYPRRCEFQQAMWNLLGDQLDTIDLAHPQLPPEVVAAVGGLLANTALDAGPLTGIFRLKPSGEYAMQIIHSMETGTPCVVYGNVPNYGLIDNLPQGCCVEVPCLVDRNGVQPTHVGTLPMHLAALMQTNVNVQGLAVEAALARRREHIYHAVMLDPHTAAELDPDQIWCLVDELIDAHGDWLPAYH